MKKLLNINMILGACLITHHLHPQTFEEAWKDMQKIYVSLNSKFGTYAQKNQEKYHTSSWVKRIEQVAKTIKGPCNPNFLYTKDIGETMVRGAYENFQRIEECYLTYCASPTMMPFITKFKETNNETEHIPGQRSELFNCSINSLGHLYYAIRSLEKNNSPQTIVEFGGGYGNLSRIFKMLIPSSTIVIVDLPELLSIQYLFLSQIVPDTEIIVHEEAISDLKKGCIHLVPIYVIKDSEFNADLFISNFALTESPLAIQELIADKKFFNASVCYLTGQLNGWRDCGNTWVPDHALLFEQVRKKYNDVDCKPYHIFLPNLLNFEIIATH